MPISRQEVEAIDEIVNEAWNQGNFEVIDRHVSDDYVFDDPSMPQEFRGREGFKNLVSQFRAAFPDIELKLDDRVIGEDEVADRFTVTGTHEGELMGIEPTGKRSRFARW